MPSAQKIPMPSSCVQLEPWRPKGPRKRWVERHCLVLGLRFCPPFSPLLLSPVSPPIPSLASALRLFCLQTPQSILLHLPLPGPSRLYLCLYKKVCYYLPGAKDNTGSANAQHQASHDSCPMWTPFLIHSHQHSQWAAQDWCSAMSPSQGQEQ